MTGQRSLLDVNVLVALFDAEHVHHEIAHDWFSDHRMHGWATCPLTENGFVRLVSHPSTRGDFMPVEEAVALLTRFRSSGHHEFWPETISICDDRVFDVSSARSHKHLTDVYLFGLAVKRSGRFVTFDRHVPLTAVKAARPQHLVVLAPAE